MAESPTPVLGTVLVTGVSGFIGLYVAIELLQRGYGVRAGLRKRAEREAGIRELIRAALPEADERLTFVELDLLSDSGWAEAVAGCRHVQHLASPVPSGHVEDPDGLTRPAREGALRVLRAAAECPDTQRVVLTSSSAAILYGQVRDAQQVYGPEHWSKVDACPAYPRSKTLAERAAWDYVDGLVDPAGPQLELVTLCPGMVYGPVLHRDHYSTSGEPIRKLLSREIPACPDVGWSPVDVRDVAWLHAEAMVVPEAAGQRFAVGLEHMWLRDVAQILAAHFGERGFRVPTRRLPSVLVRLLARFDPQVRLVLDDLGLHENLDVASTHSVLGWEPRDPAQAIRDMGESLIQLGMV